MVKVQITPQKQKKSKIILVNNCGMYCSFLNLLIRMRNSIVLGDLNFSCERPRRHKLVGEARNVKTKTILAVLSFLYFVKNDLRHSGRTGITSIAVRVAGTSPQRPNIHEIAACGSSSLASRETGPVRIS